MYFKLLNTIFNRRSESDPTRDPRLGKMPTLDDRNPTRLVPTRLVTKQFFSIKLIRFDPARPNSIHLIATYRSGKTQKSDLDSKNPLNPLGTRNQPDLIFLKSQTDPNPIQTEIRKNPTLNDAKSDPWPDDLS